MKRWLVHILLLLVFSPVMAIGWRQTDVQLKHYLTFSTNGGYFSLLENIPEVETLGGGGATLGIGYEMRYKHLWVGAALDVQYCFSSLNSPANDIDRVVYDTQGKALTYHYHVRGYTDTQHDVRIGLPVLVGFYTNGIYGGVGIHASFAPFTVATPTVAYTTRGEYERYINDFTNMPNHFYTEYTIRGRTEMKMLPQVSVIGEIGYDVLNKERISQYRRCSVLKIAAYAEYGFLNSTTGSQEVTDLFYVDANNPIRLVPVGYYTCRDVRDKRIVPLLVGVKVTFMLRIKTPNCHCDGAI